MSFIENVLFNNLTVHILHALENKYTYVISIEFIIKFTLYPKHIITNSDISEYLLKKFCCV